MKIFYKTSMEESAGLLIEIPIIYLLNEEYHNRRKKRVFSHYSNCFLIKSNLHSLDYQLSACTVSYYDISL